LRKYAIKTNINTIKIERMGTDTQTKKAVCKQIFVYL